MCDVAYAMLLDEYQSDGRALVAAGDDRAPYQFRDMLNEILESEGSPGRFVSPDERELRNALGVA